MQKILLLIILLSVASCTTRVVQKEKSQKNEVRDNHKSLICEADKDELRSITGTIRKHDFNLSLAKSMTIKRLESYYKNGASDYESQIKDLHSIYNERFGACSDNSKAKSFIDRKIDYLHELKVKRFLSYYLVYFEKEKKQARINYYSHGSYLVKDKNVEIRLEDLDSNLAKFRLKLRSLIETRVLSVNAVSLTSYLKENGLQSPLRVLTGIKIFDEFGNQYTQTSDPSMLQNIYPGKPSDFHFSTKPFIKSAKFAILRFTKKAFGNNEKMVLKVPLYRTRREPFYIAVYKELGIDGLKAESRRCTFRWEQSKSSFMPLPLGMGDVKLCALVDMLIGHKLLEKKKNDKSLFMFSENEIRKKFSDRLREKFELSEREINRLLKKWKEQISKDL